MARLVQVGLGILLLTAGLAGLLFLSQAPASAEEDRTMGRHKTMHRSMDVMQGRGTSVRMHQGQGGEEMMNACSRMHQMMDGGMMDGRDGGMMDGRDGGMMDGGDGGMMGTRTS